MKTHRPLIVALAVGCVLLFVELSWSSATQRYERASEAWVVEADEKFAYARERWMSGENRDLYFRMAENIAHITQLTIADAIPGASTKLLREKLTQYESQLAKMRP